MTGSALAPVLSFLAVAGLAGLLGRSWWHTAVGATAVGATRLFNAWLALLAGLVALYLWMMILGLIGIAWQASTVLLPPLLVAVLGYPFLRRRPSNFPRTRRSPDGGDLVAIAALGILGFLLTNAGLTMSDFVFHWGFKAHQWWLGHGIDFVALTEPWNVPRHPDYPGLVPALFVATSLAYGAFAEVPAIAWTILFAAGCMVAAREALREATHDRWLRQAALAITASTVTFMTISYRLGGSPDLLLAAIVASATAILVAPPHRDRDAAIGVLGAVAVATKIEGTPLAALMIGSYLARRYRAASNEDEPTKLGPVVARTVLPSLIVALPWWLLVTHHQLASEVRSGGFAFDRIGAIIAAVGACLINPAWHGLALVLLLLPLAWYVERTRAAAAVVTGQIAFYAWVYLDTPFDAVVLVHTSAVRLMLHIWPATMVLVTIALDHLTRPKSEGRDAAHPGQATGTISA